MPKAAIVMGSVSEVEARVISAHRTPQMAHDFANNAIENNIEVIICAAGKAAHLGGVIAAYTPLPVIGLPVKSSTMDGLDSLLSMVQMPSGIPVACVAINGGLNAGLLAIQILSVKYPNFMKARQREYTLRPIRTSYWYHTKTTQLRSTDSKRVLYTARA